MTIHYPLAWATLQHPWVREELLGYLAELADPRETEKWFNPDPRGEAAGIDQQFHFFFDDHDFDDTDVGYSLLDRDEVVAIGHVKAALQAIHATNRNGDSRYFVKHRLWPRVMNAAFTAHAILSAKGVIVE